jgi:hypothetical protein
MTGLGFTGNIVAILVLLLVIGIAWLLLRRRLGEWATAHQRKRADKGKVKCYDFAEYDGLEAVHCKKKATWVTPHGYFCDDHWEINSLDKLSNGGKSRVRWAHQLAWTKKETDVWTT